MRGIEHVLRSLGRLARHEQVILSTLAAVIGLVGGGSAIAFRQAISLFQFGFFGYGGEKLPSHASGLDWWHIMLATTGGGLVVGLCIRYLLQDRHIHSVSDVIEAVTLRGGKVSTRTGLISAAVSALSVGAGASAGREGPVVHLGATISAFVADKLKLGRSLTRTLVGCGVAAAVAASFNAPIAGVFFALEVVVGHYTLRAFSPIVISSVTGTLVSREFFGDFPAFIIPDYNIASVAEFPAFALLGLTSAAVAIIFMRSIAFTQHYVQRSPVPEWLRPACAGFLVGIIALYYPQVLGVGYEATDNALNELLSLDVLLILLVLKVAATAISLGSGFGGGVFSPSLFLGAMLGGAFGIIATSVFPHLSSGHGAYTIVGMGAVAGAVLGAPISTILMVFELTSDYSITIAVMIATVVASTVTQQIYGHSFFTWQLANRGLNLKGGREQRFLRSILIRDVMKQDFDAVPPAASMVEVREFIQKSQYGELFVVDDLGILHGTITLQDLSGTAFDTSLDSLINAEDVARRHPPVLAPHDMLEKAMKLMDEVHEEHIAVVDDISTMRVVGFVHQVDVMNAYNTAIMQAHADERGEL